VEQTPFDLVKERLEERGLRYKNTGRKLDAQCPAHDDKHASLVVTDTGPKVLITCHAGCDRNDILAALELTWNDLFTEEPAKPAADPVVAHYDYADEQGRLVYQVTRTAGKQFRQRRKLGGDWVWNMTGVTRYPYHLPQVLQAVRDGRPVYVVEGEKDAEAVTQTGETATCNPGGAGKWRDDYSRFFAGADVRVVQDNDAPGRAHAAAVARSLDVAGAHSVTILASPTGKDVSDLLAAGGGLADLVPVTPTLAPDLHAFLATSDPPYDWVIADLLERGDRLVVTGPEGHGKSLFLRTIAICAAAGLHPFTGQFIPPQRVLTVDCENSERQTRRHWRRMANVAELCQRRVTEGQLRLIHRPDGLDLSSEDGPWLVEQVVNHKPDLLTIGPLYRLHSTDVNEETAARAVVTMLDKARLTVNCALILEAHSPHGEMGRPRPMRPAGSSLFLRWPEFGIGLRPWNDADGPTPARAARSPTDWLHPHVARVEQWRGPRDERDLPFYLRWGQTDTEWPWMPHSPQHQND
jgi:AAA domain